jgi:hypothetical protein
MFNVMQDLLIRHTLDVMHCEKNLCENIIKTLFGETDFPRGRMDYEDMGVRPDLWLRRTHGTNGRLFMPHAPYVLTPRAKTDMLAVIASTKVPTNYSGAIYKRVSDGRLRFLKSHDFHILMQQVITCTCGNFDSTLNHV